MTYAHYSKELQLAARFFDMNDEKVTPHGARLGKSVESFNNRISFEDIAVGGRWSALDSAIGYIRNGQASLINVYMSSFTEK